MLFFIFLNFVFSEYDDVVEETNETLNEIFQNLQFTINESISPLKIDVKNKKFLFISDFHLGKQLDPEKTIDKLFQNIYSIVKSELPDYIFILGDVVDGKCPNIIEIYKIFLINIIKISRVCYIMGGNHDRAIVDMFQKRATIPSDKIVLTNNRFLVIPTKPRLFVGHDWYFNLRVRNSVSINYMEHLRNITVAMKDDDYLIIGHTHTQITNQNRTSYSIGQFSVDDRSFDYLIVTTKDSKPRITFQSLDFEL